MIISIAAAISEYSEVAPLGDGRKQWYMPEDLKRFKTITIGHTVIIEEETFKEILKHLNGPLPDRKNIVIGKRVEPTAGVTFVDSFVEALHLCKNEEEIFLMGTSDFYAKIFSYVSKLYLTVVDGKYHTGEYFPSFDHFKIIHSERGASNNFEYTFKIFTK